MANETRSKRGATAPAPRTSQPIPRIEVHVLREAGEPSSRVSVIEGDVFRVGSHETNDIVVNDPLVSRLHCQIRNHPRGWRVVDTGSLNGTFIGGVGVRDADLTLPECRIELGASKLLVRALSSGAAAGQAAPAFGSLFGTTPAMRRLFERVVRIARAGGDVLIEGESGTGKELIAAEIVKRSARADKPFVIVDCGAVSSTLVESEFFGHAKGAFTGADRARAGAFEAAEGGTVFLDEIGELPLHMQPKLLRALAAREIRRLGENTPRRIDVRVVAATNRRLEGEVNQGKFREDLYFRLSVLRVDVPPLRERLEDIPILVGCFLEQLEATDKMPLFTSEVFDEMRRLTWPGNVRELRNYVEQYAIFDGPASDGYRQAPRSAASSDATSNESIDVSVPFRVAKEQLITEFERAYLTKLHAACSGNISEAARRSMVDRMHLHRLFQRYGIGRTGSLA